MAAFPVARQVEFAIGRLKARSWSWDRSSGTVIAAAVFVAVVTTLLEIRPDLFTFWLVVAAFFTGSFRAARWAWTKGLGWYQRRKASPVSRPAPPRAEPPTEPETDPGPDDSRDSPELG